MASTPENPWASLGPDYLPVYGSRINADSFVWDGERWLVEAHDAAGHKTQFAFENPTDGSPVVTVGGKPVEFHDIHSDAVRPATVADWCDAISYWDTQACASLHDRRWFGETIEAAVDRAAANVVAYEQHLRNLANYATPAALETELRELLAPLQVTVRTIDAWPNIRENIGRRIVDGEKDLYCGAKFVDNVVPERWLRHLDNLGLRPYLRARFEGSLLTSFEAEMSYRVSCIPEEVKISDDSSNPWWVLIFDDHDVAMPVHHNEYSLDVTIDDDGQTISFAVRPTRVVAKERKLTDEYERRWGYLIDDRHPPTPNEVEEAIALAHARIGD